MSEQDISGLWHGQYSYPFRRPPVPFAATLLDRDGTVSGSITERSPFPPHQPLYATLRGGRDGASVRFSKIYESNDPRFTIVEYDGQLNADATEIEGTWRVGRSQGKFLMIRATRRSMEVVKRIEEVIR